MSALRELVAAETARRAPEPVDAFARALGGEAGVAAVLFYGSALRTGETSGVLDFYVLADGGGRRGAKGWVERRIWPEIRFETCAHASGELRAKVAVLPLEVFARAAAGLSLDTTVWTRFVQPSRLVYVREEAVRGRVLDALAAAAVTAGRFAAVLGPSQGVARDYWAALFRETYAAELRVEPPGREVQVLDAAPDHYTGLLSLAWSAAGVPFTVDGAVLSPGLSDGETRRLRRAWRVRRRWGKPLNAGRLVKAAFTAPGAARYAAGKLARHTTVEVEVTPWRERHPVLAALPVLWRLRGGVRPRRAGPGGR